MIAILLLSMAGQPDLTTSGWLEAMALYEETRAPQEEYSMESHRQACMLFREAMNERLEDQTAHWAAVRVMVETYKLLAIYLKSDIDRKGTR